ncbi:MAG: hypothetical protein AAGL90_01590 [Pseudomonadota bacterium]
MIRLYKCDDGGKPVAYHELWIEPQHRRIVEHWGYIGDPGDTLTHRIKILRSLEKQVNALIEPVRALGFEELPERAFSTLIIVYPKGDKSPEEVRDTREDIEDALTEKLGWTGLGYCDEGREVAETYEIYCRVVDYAGAEKVIAESLDASVFGDYSRIYQE